MTCYLRYLKYLYDKATASAVLVQYKKYLYDEGTPSTVLGDNIQSRLVSVLTTTPPAPVSAICPAGAGLWPLQDPLHLH